MPGAICSAVVGLVLLLLGGLGLRSLDEAPLNRMPPIYAALMAGSVFLAYAILKTVFSPGRRERSGAVSGLDAYSAIHYTGSGDHSASGHGGDCGPGDTGAGDGGSCGGDGGGGH